MANEHNSTSTQYNGRNFKSLAIITIFVMLMAAYFVMDYILEDADPDERHNLKLDVATPVTCQIPELFPFEESILPKNISTPKNCSNDSKLGTFKQEAFKIQTGNLLIQALHLGASCCYKTIKRMDDETNDIGNTCVNISKNVTKIPPHIEFIEVNCDNGRRYRESFILVAKRPKVENRVLKYESKMASMEIKKETLSVIIIELDSVSRMHFIRGLPKTYSYLQNLSAISLKGYNKVGDGSIPNTVPIITGRTFAELKTEWIGNNAGLTNARLDSCPFIWKLFANQGYRTSYCEDSYFIALFNLYHWYAFDKPPTDYYCRPMAGHMEKIRKYDMCYGRRLSFQVLLEHVKLMAETFKDSRYYSHIMANWISHTKDTSRVSWGDEHLYNLIKYLYQNHFLNSTALLIISDHGHRSFEHLEQGKIESRMPAAFILLPSWFRTEYPVPFQNLKRNSGHILTSHFDLHRTLLDFMDLGRFRSDKFEPNHFYNASLKSMENRGMSLFERIPNSRTCAEAGIPLQWCVCHKKYPIDANSWVAQEAARAVVSHINKITQPYYKCLKRELIGINEALALQNGKKLEDDCLKGQENGSVLKRSKLSNCLVNVNLEIIFNTSPGNGTFQTVVQYFSNGTFSVPEEIIRVDTYNSQSLCVPFNEKVKPYCFCGRRKPFMKHKIIIRV